jgi:hypothetical protein
MSVLLLYQVIEVFHLQCVNDKYNFHTSLLIAVVAPIVVGSCFVLYVAIIWFVHTTPEKYKVAKDNALKWFLIFLYCVFPIVSNYGSAEPCQHKTSSADVFDTILLLWCGSVLDFQLRRFRRRLC